MKESNYKSYDKLPLFLNASIVSKVLGISSLSGYELMHSVELPCSENWFKNGCAKGKIS